MEKPEKKDKSKKSGKKSDKKAKLGITDQEKPIKLVLKVGENVMSKESKRKSDKAPKPSTSGEFIGKAKSKDHGSKKKKKKRSSSKERKKTKLAESPSVSSSVPIEFQCDAVTKMIFLKYGFYSFLQNNLTEKGSHAKKWLFSALNS